MKGISLYTDEDEMSATLTFEVEYNSQALDVNDIMNYIRKQGVVYGISRKRISSLIHQIIDAKPNTKVSAIIAKGLPPKDGLDSRTKPLVLNVFEKYLKSQEQANNEIDIQNFVNALHVIPNAAIATRLPPTLGRLGKTITGKSITAKPGNYNEIKLGSNTKLSPTNENLILASVSGLAKFENGAMSIEKTLCVNGVNVSTGNISHVGAVVVNGDVTENMKISANGDIIIIGYVESAFIQADGDIIITEGATGKVHDEDCQIIAKGNIFLHHGQNLNLNAGKEINVAKQLAYSIVKSTGNITIGKPEKPMGNLFASTIYCNNKVSAGSIGAISGTELILDFSEGHNLICDQLDSLVDLHSKLLITNTNHNYKFAELKNLQIPEYIKSKFLAINDEIDAERVLLKWLNNMQIKLQKRKSKYESNMLVVANKELFPGVAVKLNNNIWRSQSEYQQCRIELDSGIWKIIH